MFKSKSRTTAKLFAIAAILVSSLMLVNSASATTAGIKPSNTIKNSFATSCTTQTFAATATSANYLSISNIPSSCYGLTLIAQVVAPASSSSITATATISSGTINFTSASAIAAPGTVEGVRVLVNGWNMPTTWTYNNTTSDPIQPDPSTPGITITTSYSQTASTSFCASITVSTTSATPVPWKADLVINGPPFNGDTNAGNYQINSSANYKFESNTPTNGRFIVIGAQPGHAQVSSSSPRSFTVCNYSTPPPSGPSTAPGVVYTQTETIPTASYYVCKTVTVSVTGSPTFFVGWESTVDVTNLRNLYVPGSGGSVQGTGGGFNRVLVSGNIYKVTGTGYNTTGVRDGNPVSYSICWG